MEGRGILMEEETMRTSPFRSIVFSVFHFIEQFESRVNSRHHWKKKVPSVGEPRVRVSETCGMFHAFVSLIARGWKLFEHSDDAGNAAAAIGRECKDGLLWFHDIGKFAAGDSSMAVVQANQVFEDQSQIESGGFSTFIGIYDGHGGPDCSCYVCDNLFRNLQELYKMVCEPDETDLNIRIPAVMLPLDAGTRLEKMLATTSSGELPCACFVDFLDDREAAIEQDKLLKDASDELPNTKYASVSGVVNMNVKATVLFVVFASCFLFMLYKLMSSWFIDVLVVLFCIGGIEGLQTCLVALLSRWFKHAGESYIKVPFLGAISYLTLAVSPFCITFSILWAVYRNESFAWIGQDILLFLDPCVGLGLNFHSPWTCCMVYDSLCSYAHHLTLLLFHHSLQLYHPSALNTFEQIVYSAKGKQIVVFLDYDGTLSPIVVDPDKAFMTRKGRDILQINHPVGPFGTKFFSAIETSKCDLYIPVSKLKQTCARRFNMRQ
ncbi:hypothetical protein JHK82_055426 [Glycine max]|nr:hypothetical protein JHK85_056254 [Glycine max]KAG5076731.1 hypothetical protein JHK82_055426 [Glycine max]